MNFVKLTVLCLITTFFMSCGNKTQENIRKPSKNIDSTVWIDNLIDAKAAAQKENKKIFLFFSGDDQDKSSASLKKSVFNTQEFMSEMQKKYVLANLDFSNSLYESAMPSPNASEEEKKQSEQIMAKLEENSKDASMYNIQATPSFFLLTKEGYVISELIFDEEPKSADDFFKFYETLSTKITEYENLLTSATKGKKEDRLNAINKLFEITDPQLRFLLQDFSAYYIKTDKNNKTGMVGTHVVALANANAVKAYLNQDPLTASEEFAKAALNKFLTPDEKQQCFYTAGFLFVQSGTTDYQKVGEYFKKAYDASPESPYAETILSMMRMMEERYAEQPSADSQNSAK
ncbi:thioredoxin family protein [Treponema pectinovorum]|uniref:thioredoxin family protein n=1 Tax=Treponema pectinovorum TaxID=164 RepID=UPI00164D032B|nr:thioredoxin family protein [Treponema pectinovorum]